MLTVTMLLLIGGVIALASAVKGWIPLWISVLLLYLWALLSILPVR